MCSTLPGVTGPSYQDFPSTKKVPISVAVQQENRSAPHPAPAGTPAFRPGARERPSSGVSRTFPSVCVIGAGSAGLVAIKSLKSAGISPDCFEMGDRVGGMWAIENQNGRGGAYRSLHINTSTREMEFSDFPIRKDIGDFPSHVHVAEYFADYAEYFDLCRHIDFRKRVAKCEPFDRGYRVHVESIEGNESFVRSYDALIVANGHHWSPAFPESATFASFDGIVLHSHHYVDPSDPVSLSNQRVLVVGMGNSAMDIACELSGPEGAARSVCVAARRGAWVLPKYILGKPLDQGHIIPMWLPGKLRRRLVTRAFRLLHGRMSDFGLPEPDHLIGEAHPTVSDHFPWLVRSGAITMRSGFERAEGSTVTFSNGENEDFDAIVFCTGYDLKFPFFDAEHISAPNNVLPLYHRAFHADHRHVFFVGLAQTVGAIMPVAEAQAEAIAQHLTGKYALPDRSEMLRRIASQETRIKERFLPSKRHTMQVIPKDFLRELKADLEAGKVRTRSGTGISFFPPATGSTP